MPVAKPQTPPDGRTLKRIVFVGDSLVHRSAKDHGLLDAIQESLAKQHPACALIVVDAGVNGNRVADILSRIERDVIVLRQDAVVLYWDSDVSDVDEADMTPAEVREIRSAYDRTLRELVKRLLVSGAFVIISGPSLIGERPRGHNEKDGQLDAYRRINRRVAASFRIRYVDTRRAFFGARQERRPMSRKDC